MRKFLLPLAKCGTISQFLLYNDVEQNITTFKKCIHVN